MHALLSAPDNLGFDPAPLLAACTKLFGVDTELRAMSQARVPATLLPAWLREPLVAIELEREADGVAEHVLLECSRTDAARLVGLAAGTSNEALEALGEGMLVYVAARLLAESQTTWRLRSRLLDRARLLDAIGGRDVTAHDVELKIGAHTIRLRALSEAPSHRDDQNVEVDADLDVNPGDVIVLSATDVAHRWQTGDHVTVSAQGRVVADGQWVRVDGQPGVRIARVMR